MSAEIVWSCRRFEQLSTEDLYRILQLRAEVFVVEQDCVYQDLDGFDQRALHVLGELEGSEGPQLLSYSRLFPAGIKYKTASIGRVLTREAARGGGTGRALMLNSIDFCRQHWPGEAITISAQQYLEAFYAGLGFETESEPYAEDGIPHIRMRLSP